MSDKNIIEILRLLFHTYATFTNNKLIGNQSFIKSNGRFGPLNYKRWKTSNENGIKLEKLINEYIGLLLSNDLISLSSQHELIARALNDSINSIDISRPIPNRTQEIVRKIYNILYPGDPDFRATSRRKIQRLQEFLQRVKPPTLLPVRFQKGSTFIDPQSELEQQAMTPFIQEGVRAQKRARKIIKERQEAPLRQPVSIPSATPPIIQPPLPRSPTVAQIGQQVREVLSDKELARRFQQQPPTIQAPAPRQPTGAGQARTIRGKSFLTRQQTDDIFNLIGQDESLRDRLKALGFNSQNIKAVLDFLLGGNIFNFDEPLQNPIIRASLLLAGSQAINAVGLNLPILLSILRLSSKSIDRLQPFLSIIAETAGIALSELVANLQDIPFTEERVETKASSIDRATQGSIKGSNIYASVVDLVDRINQLERVRRVNLTSQQTSDLQNAASLVSSVNPEQLIDNERVTDLISSLSRAILGAESGQKINMDQIVSDIITQLNNRMSLFQQRIPTIVNNIAPESTGLRQRFNDIKSNIPDIENQQREMENELINAQRRVAQNQNLSEDQRNTGVTLLQRLAIANGFRRIQELSIRVRNDPTLSSVSNGIIDSLIIIAQSPLFQAGLAGVVAGGAVGGLPGAIAGGVAGTVGGPAIGQQTGGGTSIGGTVAGTVAGGATQSTFVPKVITALLNKKEDPKVQPQPQTKEQKRGLLRPKFILPSVDVLESTTHEINADQDEWALFNFVQPGNNIGSEGNSQNNPLKASNEMEKKVRFTNNNIELIFTNGESMSVNDRAMENRFVVQDPITKDLIDSLPVMNFDLFELEVEPKSWGQPDPQNNPYNNFSDVDGSNSSIQHSLLYGLVP
jgi:hypothetical protein